MRLVQCCEGEAGDRPVAALGALPPIELDDVRASALAEPLAVAEGHVPPEALGQRFDGARVEMVIVVVRDDREAVGRDRLDRKAGRLQARRDQRALREVRIREEDIVALVDREGRVTHPGDAGAGLEALEIRPVVRHDGDLRRLAPVEGVSRELPSQQLPQAPVEGTPGVEEAAALAGLDVIRIEAGRIEARGFDTRLRLEGSEARGECEGTGGSDGSGAKPPHPSPRRGLGGLPRSCGAFRKPRAYRHGPGSLLGERKAFEPVASSAGTLIVSGESRANEWAGERYEGGSGAGRLGMRRRGRASAGRRCAGSRPLIGDLRVRSPHDAPGLRSARDAGT